MALRDLDPTPEPVRHDAAEPAPRPKPFSRGKLLRWLKFTQRYSAYAIVAFAGLHLTSTVVLPPFSMPAANSAFMAAREIYQSALGEKVLVYGAFGLHVISGLILRAVRIFSQYSDFGKIGLGSSSPITYSGFVLSFLTMMHFIALRVGPPKALGDSSLISLDYITFGLNQDFAKLSIGLVLLVSVFSFHSIEGLNQYLRLKLRPITRYAAVAAIAALTIKSVTTLAAEPVATGWLAEQYHLAESVTERLLGAK